MLDKRPPEDVDEDRFVDKSNKPLREDEVRALAVEGLGGAGAFVTLVRFFPNFFFPDGRELFLYMELIVCVDGVV